MTMKVLRFFFTRKAVIFFILKLDGEGTSYKKKKLKDLKNKAASAHNWNTLFLGTNAVATLMAERYSTTKQQVGIEPIFCKNKSINNV